MVVAVSVGVDPVPAVLLLGQRDAGVRQRCRDLDELQIAERAVALAGAVVLVLDLADLGEAGRTRPGPAGLGLGLDFRESVVAVVGVAPAPVARVVRGGAEPHRGEPVGDGGTARRVIAHERGVVRSVDRLPELTFAGVRVGVESEEDELVAVLVGVGEGVGLVGVAELVLDRSGRAVRRPEELGVIRDPPELHETFCSVDQVEDVLDLFRVLVVVVVEEEDLGHRDLEPVLALGAIGGVVAGPVVLAVAVAAPHDPGDAEGGESEVDIPDVRGAGGEVDARHGGLRRDRGPEGVAVELHADSGPGAQGSIQPHSAIDHARIDVLLPARRGRHVVGQVARQRSVVRLEDRVVRSRPRRRRCAGGPWPSERSGLSGASAGEEGECRGPEERSQAGEGGETVHSLILSKGDSLDWGS